MNFVLKIPRVLQEDKVRLSLFFFRVKPVKIIKLALSKILISDHVREDEGKGVSPHIKLITKVIFLSYF